MDKPDTEFPTIQGYHFGNHEYIYIWKILNSPNNISINDSNQKKKTLISINLHGLVCFRTLLLLKAPFSNTHMCIYIIGPEKLA